MIRKVVGNDKIQRRYVYYRTEPVERNFASGFTLSPPTRTLAKQACFDCHSNETEWRA